MRLFVLGAFAVSFFLLPPAPSIAAVATPLSDFNPATLPGIGDGLFLEGSIFAISTAFPIRNIVEDTGWEHGFSGESPNRLDGYWKGSTGLIYGGWRFAVFHRGELFTKSNQDTAEILGKVLREQDLPVGKRFDIDLTANGFSAAGIELSRGFRFGGALKGLQAGATARYLKGQMIQVADVKGYAIPTQPNAYDFNLSMDYYYDRNLIYKREHLRPCSGDGFSFDVGLRYEFSEKMHAEVNVRDLLGRISWYRVPYTNANATSSIKDFDENGYMRFRPVLKGWEIYKNYLQHIPVKADVSLAYNIGPFQLNPAINIVEKVPAYYWMCAQWSATEKVSLEAAYNFNYQVLSLGVAYRQMYLRIYADNVPTMAKVAGFSFALHHRF